MWYYFSTSYWDCNSFLRVFSLFSFEKVWKFSILHKKGAVWFSKMPNQTAPH